MRDGSHASSTGCASRNRRRHVRSDLLLRAAGPLVLPLLAVHPLSAQQSSTITVSPAFAVDGYVAARAPIELTLSRVPTAAEGRIAVFVGTSDLTSLFEAVGSGLVYRSNGVDLPSGESELKVFLVDGPAWNELTRMVIRVLTPRGFEKAQIDPGMELRNTGQLAEGHSGTQPAPARPTYQSIAGTLGLQTTHRRDGWSLSSDTHLLGAGERADALRFGEKGDQASRIDLADYVLRFEGRNTVLSVGHVSAGMNRHLINGFSSRGVTAVVGGPRVSWSVGAENGTSIVGTDNIVGLERGDHRIVSSGLALEVFPARPGALHVDATVLRGSVLATSGFTQGGIISADRSDGYGVQLAASTPSQRVRLAAGLASSRSEFAADPPLSSGSSLVPLQPHRRTARYAEVYVGLMQDRKVFGAIPMTLNAALRHERVDPLYRSVASFTQSDIQRDGVDIGGNVDAVSVQVALVNTADNLDAIASLLTSRTRSSSVTLGTPLASVLRITRGASWLPTVWYAQQRMHQFGAGIPTGGGFTASDVPDQLSVVQDVSVQWQVKQWQLAYRVNQSDQDNRQPGRELADFATLTHTIAVGVMAGSTLSLGLDLGLERQENQELGQVNHVRRAGVTGNWRVTANTTLDGSIRASRTEDPGAGSDTHVSSVQGVIAHGFNLWRATDGTPRGQVFLRFARYSSELFNLGGSFAPPTQAFGTWNVASGLTLRLF
ncbi:MAG: hypothetical protein HY704_13660 [Gemmatimonadetes bacterium]|nr:hypothetical protein [Gemmatimonadota bacterium]